MSISLIKLFFLHSTCGSGGRIIKAHNCHLVFIYSYVQVWEKFVYIYTTFYNIFFFYSESVHHSAASTRKHTKKLNIIKKCQLGKITSTSFTSGSGCKESGHNYRKDRQLSGQLIHGVFKNLFFINLFFCYWFF